VKKDQFAVTWARAGAQRKGRGVVGPPRLITSDKKVLAHALDAGTTKFESLAKMSSGGAGCPLMNQLEALVLNADKKLSRWKGTVSKEPGLSWKVTGRRPKGESRLRQASHWFPSLGVDSEFVESDSEEDEGEVGSDGVMRRRPRRGTSSDDLQSRVNLEILRLLKSGRHGSRGGTSDHGPDGLDDAFDVKELRAVTALRRRFNDRAHQLYSEYETANLR